MRSPKSDFVDNRHVVYHCGTTRERLEILKKGTLFPDGKTRVEQSRTRAVGATTSEPHQPSQQPWRLMRLSCKVLVAQYWLADQARGPEQKPARPANTRSSRSCSFRPNPVLCRLPTTPAAACRPPPTMRCTTPPRAPRTAWPPQEPLQRLQFRLNPVLRHKT